MSRRFFSITRRISCTTSRLISGCRRNDKWFLIHVRKHRILPSRWTQSWTLVAEKRVIPYTTEIHRRLQNYSHDFGCSASAASMIFGISMVKTFVWLLISLSSHYWQRILQSDKCGPGGDWRESSLVRTMEENGKECQTEEETKVDTWKFSTR